MRRIAYVVLALCSLSAQLTAQQPSREVQGLVRGAPARSLTLRVADDPTRMLGLVETVGTNTSIGPIPFLDGASVRNVETWDFIAGSGGSDRSSPNSPVKA
jgi:hypothetical protein